MENEKTIKEMIGKLDHYWEFLFKILYYIDFLIVRHIKVKKKLKGE